MQWSQLNKVGEPKSRTQEAGLMNKKAGFTEAAAA